MCIWGYYGTHYRVSISSFWGIVFYIRNIILLGSTTKKHYSYGVFPSGASPKLCHVILALDNRAGCIIFWSFSHAFGGPATFPRWGGGLSLFPGGPLLPKDNLVHARAEHNVVLKDSSSCCLLRSFYIRGQ